MQSRKTPVGETLNQSIRCLQPDLINTRRLKPQPRVIALTRLKPQPSDHTSYSKVTKSDITR